MRPANLRLLVSLGRRENCRIISGSWFHVIQLNIWLRFKYEFHHFSLFAWPGRSGEIGVGTNGRYPLCEGWNMAGYRVFLIETTVQWGSIRGLRYGIRALLTD